ncbi:hypothetical protein ACGFNU_41365 [Spirillospora sp. NPDC048911]|uniref:hypothetical protein n=1 Tax=Spirillospora sp. NPDC048911 TaxID=3364527 RepID=UPI003714538A
MRRRLGLTAATAAAMLTGAALSPGAVADIKQTKVVSANPANTTPHVLDGTVRAIAVVGTKVVVGGNFTKVREAGSGKPQIARKNLFAFDAKTGKVDTAFKPAVNSTVYALQTGDANTVYAGGGFWTVNGTQTGGLVRLGVPNGKLVTAFKPNVGGGVVYDFKRHGAKIYLGGMFTKVRGVTRNTLAAVNATSGALDTGFALTPSDPRAGALKVFKMAINPQGTRLLINGTFTRVSGQRRAQIAMIDTQTSPAKLSSWATEQYADLCNINSFHTYMRGMDFSPDGAYFVVVTTGGGYGTSALCDSAARWETAKTGSGQRPTWVNWTGGDTLLATAVTGAAVYVGGHQRWQDNPYGRDFAGPGAVSRPGIAALNPATGKALAWNPTRTRGHGVETLVATPNGLFVGSDTDQLGKEYHGRVGFFPLS